MKQRKERKMVKTYVCVANGIGKESGQPYSRFCAIVYAKKFEFIQTKDSFTVQEIIPLLTVKTLTDGEE
jgi:hypothetical protein